MTLHYFISVTPCSALPDIGISNVILWGGIVKVFGIEVISNLKPRTPSSLLKQKADHFTEKLAFCALLDMDRRFLIPPGTNTPHIATRENWNSSKNASMPPDTDIPILRGQQ